MSQSNPLHTFTLPTVSLDARTCLMSANIDFTLTENGKAPEYSDADAAGADLFLDLRSEDVLRNNSLRLKSMHHGMRDIYLLDPGKRVTLSTGVSFSMPEGTYGKVFDRSGLASKNGLLTTGGVIDCNYRGVVKVILTNNDATTPIELTHHMKIAQIVFQPYIHGYLKQVESLDKTSRGDKGFGSTGV